MLAEMALPEPWRFKNPIYLTKNPDTPILERYIHAIFKKQLIDYKDERNPSSAADYFHIENEFCCFHTGLYTRRYKAIYACFDRNKKKDSLLEWYRATKAECLDLPETTDVIRQIELEPAALRIYRGLVKESYAELAGGEVTATNILTRLLRLSQLTGGFLGNDETAAVEQVSAAKLSALEDILDGAVAEGKKLVIIARFIPEIKAICKLLEKRGLGYSCITGEVKNRDEQVARFQNEPEVMAFVGQIATAGLGITLTAASTMVFYSLDYSMSNFEQTKARIHRMGQRIPCTYLYLVARGTVDEKVLAALESKADLARTLVDDYRSGRNPFAA